MQVSAGLHPTSMGSAILHGLEAQQPGFCCTSSEPMTNGWHKIAEVADKLPGLRSVIARGLGYVIPGKTKYKGCLTLFICSTCTTTATPAHQCFPARVFDAWLPGHALQLTPLPSAVVRDLRLGRQAQA